MDENTVVTVDDTTNVTPDQNQETVKPEPKKDEKPVNAEVEKLKAALTKASADAAEYKRQLREKQTEAERAEAERAEQEQFDDLYQAELIYIRKSEAEVQWEARNQQTQA